MNYVSVCLEHPTNPLSGCNNCWAIEKNRRGQISCKFRICTSGSCKFRHDPYKHQPNISCRAGSQCEIPWCGYLHPNLQGCGHQRPTPNCLNCQTENLNKEARAKQTACTGNCKFNSNNVCYFSHGVESESDSASASESDPDTDSDTISDTKTDSDQPV